MNFRQLLLIMRARIWVVLFTLAVTVVTAVVLTKMLPKKYNAATTLVIDIKGTDAVGGVLIPSQFLPGYMATQVDIIQSHKVALKVVKMLRLTDDPKLREQFANKIHGTASIDDWMADLLLRNLKVEPSKEGSAVQLRYTANNPKAAADIANAFAQAYIDTNLELRVEPARQTAVWFDEQLKVLRRNLEDTQKRLSAYQREKGIVATDERFDVENARLADLSNQLVRAQAEAYDTSSRQRQVNEYTTSGRSLDKIPEVISSPLIQSLKTDLSRSEAKLNEMSARLGMNHPQYEQQLSEVESLRRRLDQEIKTVTSGVGNLSQTNLRREAELRNALAAQKAKIMQINRQRDDLAVLTREVENAQKAYDAAMQRFNQTNLESRTTQTNVSILNRAVAPVSASSPVLVLNVVIAFLLGTALGMVFAFTMEMADRRVRSDDDLKEQFAFPLLATLERSSSRVKRLGAQRLLGIKRSALPAPAH